MKSLLTYSFIFLGILTFQGCDNEDDINPTETGSITIEFDNRIGETDLELGTDYINPHGETFRITTLSYYISNLVLIDVNGNEYTVPQDSSYFLITESNENSHKATINNVPAGDYNQIRFMIGVDSMRSTMDISKRTGVLDPAHGHDGMYWAWNSGYIFFKMEGTSPAAPADNEHKFSYHIGGFGGYDSPTINNIRTQTVDFGSARAEVRQGKKPQVHLHVDILEFFANPTEIKIADYPLVMFSPFSETVSANYTDMFKYDHVHN